jgi:hypothetical protein
VEPRQPGMRAVWLSAAFLAVMFLLAATPLAWILQGRPSESYPELLFLGFGVPLGLALVLLSGARLWWLRRRGTRSYGGRA